MRWLSVCLVLLLSGIGLLAGCDRDQYQIEMKTDGDALERKLTCWHDTGGESQRAVPLKADRLEQIGKLYATRESAETDAKQVFVGRFVGTTPSDVGGKGSFTRFVSPLGTTAAYVERFRGDDDLDARLERTRRAADQLADVIAGWLTAELGKEPNFNSLKQWLDAGLPKDIRNLSALSCTGNAVTTIAPDANNEILVRAVQYLAEREYFAPKDIPALARDFQSESFVAVLKHLQRLLARKMGVADNQPIPVALAFLGDDKKLQASLDKYLADSQLFKDCLAKWKAKNPQSPDAEQPQPSQAFGELACTALLGRDSLFAPTADSLRLTLACPVRPYTTNGTWDDAMTQVSWSQELDVDRVLPAECFAFWSVPDEAFQNGHFGKVLLCGDVLGRYCVWYCGLTADEARQWNAMIEGCDSKQEFRQKIEAFRFEGEAEPSGENKPPSLANEPRQLLLDSLNSPGTADE